MPNTRLERSTAPSHPLDATICCARVAAQAQTVMPHQGGPCDVVRRVLGGFLVVVLCGSSQGLRGQENGMGPQFLPGIHIGVVERIDVGATLLFPTRVDSIHPGVFGWFLSAEPGFAGVKAAIGYGGLSPLFGAVLRTSVFQSWADERIARNQTFVGAEVRLRFLLLGLGVGWFIRVRGTASGDGSFLTAQVIGNY
jgi:hypothetical protein